MASLHFSFLLFSFTCFLLLNSSASASASASGQVGQKTDIKDVAMNKTMQSLGLFSVAEYNRQLFLAGKTASTLLRLSFYKVVSAQQQVVSGIKYFLKLSAKDYSGITKTYDAVVYVQPWTNSKKLLTFAASTTKN